MEGLRLAISGQRADRGGGPAQSVGCVGHVAATVVEPFRPVELDHFGAALPGFIDDADGDGIDNGIEHILGSDPSMPSQGLRDVSTGTGTFVFRHSRTNALAVDVSPGYQWSTDMLTWYASGTTNPGGTLVDLTTVTVTDTAAPLNDEIEVTATVTGSAPTLFVRLTSQR